MHSRYHGGRAVNGNAYSAPRTRVSRHTWSGVVDVGCCSGMRGLRWLWHQCEWAWVVQGERGMRCGSACWPRCGAGSMVAPSEVAAHANACRGVVAVPRFLEVFVVVCIVCAGWGVQHAMQAREWLLHGAMYLASACLFMHAHAQGLTHHFEGVFCAHTSLRRCLLRSASAARAASRLPSSSSTCDRVNDSQVGTQPHPHTARHSPRQDEVRTTVTWFVASFNASRSWRGSFARSAAVCDEATSSA